MFDHCRVINSVCPMAGEYKEVSYCGMATGPMKKARIDQLKKCWKKMSNYERKKHIQG